MQSELIQIGDKFYNKCKVVMLPTKHSKVATITDKEGIRPVKYISASNNDAFIYEDSNGFIIQPQNIYILSHKNIEEGWIIGLDDELHYVKEKGTYPKVIISTTDTFLKIECQGCRFNKLNKVVYTCSCQSFPEPSDEFIRNYCDKDCKIDDILVEYEQLCCQTGAPCGYPCNGEENCKKSMYIKVSSNNIITTKLISERIYTREDMHRAFCAGADFDMKAGLSHGNEYYLFTRWIDNAPI